MSNTDPSSVPPVHRVSGSQYRELLYRLQIELVKLQRHVMATEQRFLLIFEGRDTAGKDGTIKRFIENMRPRETRVVALGKPSDRDRDSWYFQRYVAHLPANHEIVFFNRSWYNRAGVERVMGFSSEEDCEQFMNSVVPFEQLLVRSGTAIFKYYLDIDRDEQIERLDARRQDPLKEWKISSIDERAVDLWEPYTQARNNMLARTHHLDAPWTVVRANHKKTTRLAVIRDFLSRVDYPDRDPEIVIPDPNVAATYQDSHLTNGMLSR